MLNSKLKDIEALSKLVERLALNKVQSTRLNRVSANAMRRVIAKNIREQKDIHNKNFAPRKKPSLVFRKNAQIKFNKKMFGKISRLSKVFADSNDARVGFNNKLADLVDLHNTGGLVRFKRSNAKWVSYNIAKREFFGWSKEMIKEVEQAVMNEYMKLSGVH